MITLNGKKFSFCFNCEMITGEGEEYCSALCAYEDALAQCCCHECDGDKYPNPADYGLTL